MASKSVADALINQAIEDMTPEEIAEQAIGLIARASYRMRRDHGKIAQVDMLSRLLLATTRLHTDAREVA